MNMEIKNKLIMLIGGAGVTAVVYLLFKYIFPVVAPFVIAFLIAYAIEKPAKKLSKRFRGNKVIAATVLMVIFAAILLLGLGFITYKVGIELKSLVYNYDHYMDIANAKVSDLCNKMDGWMGLGVGETLDFINQNTDDFMGKVHEKIIPAIMDGSLPLMFKIITFIAVFFIILLTVIYISKDFDKIKEWKERTMFASEVKILSERLNLLLKVYFKVQLIIMTYTATVCVAGLLLLKNPYAIVFGIIIGILDAFPMFGTGTVLIPWSIISIFMGRFYEGAMLFTIYIITYFIREFMESKYMGDQLGISPFTMVVNIYVGLMVYGILGFILGPVSYVIIKTMILYLKSQLERGKLSKI